MLGKHKWKVRPLRRITQICIMILIIAVPLYSQNPDNGAPSLIIKGYLPQPSVSDVYGDTWSFSVGDFTIIHPVAFFDFIFSTKSVSFSLLIAVLIPLVITLFFGSVFCSWLCPAGFILELTTKLNIILKKRGLIYKIRIRNFRYVILTVSLLLAFFSASPVISVLDPPHLLGIEFIMLFTHQEISISGVIFLVTILLFEMFFVSRAWCRYFCPSGACLSLLGIKRICKITVNQKECISCNKCRTACPYGLAPDQMENYKTLPCAICDNCGLCRDICPSGAISYDFGFDLKSPHLVENPGRF